jgi:hypothetical protein
VGEATVVASPWLCAQLQHLQRSAAADAGEATGRRQCHIEVCQSCQICQNFKAPTLLVLRLAFLLQLLAWADAQLLQPGQVAQGRKVGQQAGCEGATCFSATVVEHHLQAGYLCDAAKLLPNLLCAILQSFSTGQVQVSEAWQPAANAVDNYRQGERLLNQGHKQEQTV